MTVDRETEALMESIAKKAAIEAVGRTLISLGIDYSDPIEAQQNFAALGKVRALLDDPEVQKDCDFMREMRDSVDCVKRKGMVAIAGLLCVGAVAFLMYGFNLKIPGK